MDAKALAELQVIYYPNPSLEEEARPVEDFGSDIAALGKRMIEIMYEEDGVGLAATQLGISQRLVIVRDPHIEGSARAYANPVIVSRGGKRFEEEGCLSVPGVRARVQRAANVTVHARTVEGDELQVEAEGLIATAWQHEIDHLDGVLFIDKVGPASRIIMRRRLKELEENHRREGR